MHKITFFIYPKISCLFVEDKPHVTMVRLVCLELLTKFIPSGNHVVPILHWKIFSTRSKRKTGVRCVIGATFLWSREGASPAPPTIIATNKKDRYLGVPIQSQVRKIKQEMEKIKHPLRALQRRSRDHFSGRSPGSSALDCCWDRQKNLSLLENGK